MKEEGKHNQQIQQLEKAKGVRPFNIIQKLNDSTSNVSQYIKIRCVGDETSIAIESSSLPLSENGLENFPNGNSENLALQDEINRMKFVEKHDENDENDLNITNYDDDGLLTPPLPSSSPLKLQPQQNRKGGTIETGRQVRYPLVRLGPQSPNQKIVSTQRDRKQKKITPATAETPNRSLTSLIHTLLTD